MIYLARQRRWSGYLGRAISVDRMSYKDASAEQSQDCRDCFNHFSAPRLSLENIDSRRLFQDRFIKPT
jgi:hypothetical protein